MIVDILDCPKKLQKIGSIEPLDPLAKSCFSQNISCLLPCFPTGHVPLAQDPHSPGTLNNLAVAEYRQGRMHAAIAPWMCSNVSPGVNYTT